MKALCYKCNHSWNYKGKITEDKKYLTCSKCYYRIRIDRALDFSTQEHQKLLTNSIKLPSFKAKIPTYSLTHSLLEKPSIKLPIPIKRFSINKITPEMFNLEDDEIEEEFEEELFPIQITKLCKEHNLPARYDDYDLGWRCSNCIEMSLFKEMKFKEMREFQNIADFANNLMGKNPEIKIKEIPY